MAKSVVARVAPEESDHYTRVRAEFFARGGPGRVQDNPLGFGEIVVGVVTGIVLTVLRDLAIGSLTDAARPWWDRAWRWAARRVLPGRRPQAGPDTPLPALPAEAAPAVIALVTKHAAEANLPPAQADRLARAIVAELSAPAAVEGEAGAGSGD
ncbi:hypothetical protein LG943_07595 [Streptomonospora sp. S1-112]|uniref:Uncharacterized protein n=1 Tax=Streptomonospora mangrovi TaxID=2883123 RepID=A0A9X3NJI7_9ACTN|nr:hypothetical protein [Streptomonospora mangrovi]MDA0564190.1 hypothetical protein [Streptomonospora mangrovi]